MESLQTALQQFAKHVSKTASIYATVIMIFAYHVIFEKDLTCTCKKPLRDCWLYMTLPAFLIIVLILWMDNTFQRALKYTCGYCKSTFFCVIWYHIIKAAFIGSLWVSSVLMDGDWYVCCWNDQTELQAQLACKDKTNITAEERVIIAELKNNSRVVGLPLLVCVTTAAALMSSIPWKKCCTTDSSEKSYCCKKSVLFDTIILEEGADLVTNRLKEAAKDKLTEKLNTYVTDEKWGNCFDVAEDLIKEPKPAKTAADPSSSRPPAEPSLSTQPRDSSYPGQSTQL